MGHPEGLGYHTREAPPNTTEALPTDYWAGRWLPEEAAGHIGNTWPFCHFSC